MTVREGEVRAFVALYISEAARQALTGAIASLRAAIPPEISRAIRWVDPKGIHLTLKFLGNIDSGLVEQVLDSMKQSARISAPFSLELSDLGVFPGRRAPRVLWAGIGGDLDALGHLQRELESNLATQGFQREERGFNPHLTIGRVRNGGSRDQGQRIVDAVASVHLEPTDPWRVDELHLMRSTLTPQGALYDSLGAVSI